MNISIIGILGLTLFSCGQASLQLDDSKLTVAAQKDTCDNPDANIGCCFINIPVALTNTMTITSEEEAGERLSISGTIYKADGKTPFSNVILYAYHTDNKGYYSKNGTETGVQKWHGRLHGWCRTDKNGTYEIQTIRPALYPDNSMPAHIHAAVKTGSGEMFWITDYVFKDDDLVNETYLSSLANVGGTGVVDIKRDSEKTWTGKRDIMLR